MKASKNLLFDNCKILIQKYISKENIIWPREIKIAKKLLSLYPIEFWLQYSPEIEIYSLSIFLTPSAKKELSKEHSLFCLTKPKEEIILEKMPVIQLEETSKKDKKSRSLLEFVDEVL